MRCDMKHLLLCEPIIALRKAYSEAENMARARA